MRRIEQAGNRQSFSEAPNEAERFDPIKIRRLAEVITGQSLGIVKGDRLFLRYNPGGRQLVEIIKQVAKKQGAEVRTFVSNESQLAERLAKIDPNSPDEECAKIARREIKMTKWGNKLFSILYDDTPRAMDIVNPTVMQAFKKARSALPGIVQDKARKYSMIHFPTQAEADIDGISHTEEINTFFDACNRPWKEIEDAQEILIRDILAPGKKIRFVSGEGLNPKWKTDLTMDIEGQNWVNSTIQRNFPGSETFSSPIKDTTNGRLAINYPLKFISRVIPNLILEFKDGKVVNFETYNKEGSLDKTNMEWIEKMLGMDEGACQVGEVAFGTNNVLKWPFLNDILMEKVAGSFHIAVGRALDVAPNGVKSNIHIDLVRMMLEEYGGGEVFVDGKLIQKNGRFLDPRLAVLNPAV